MIEHSRPRSGRSLIVSIALVALGVAIVWACGPFFTEYRTVATTAPANPAAYDRGDLGVVRPAFARRYLVQAYRTINGAPHVALEPLQAPPVADTFAAARRWLDVRARVVAVWPEGIGKTAPDIDPSRWLPDFVAIDNCLVDSFDRAMRTLDAHVRRYGAASRQVREWLAAQDAVFANCGGKDLVLPPAVSAGADPLERADRAYQTASALFYATRYEDAARAFRTIAGDTQSPWRLYGHYLAGRAWLRAATVADVGPASYLAHLESAAAELQQTLDDGSAAPLHDSARGLQELIASRRDPVGRIAVLSRRLGTAPSVSPADLVGYTRLLDIALERSGAGDADPRPRIDRSALLDADDMTAWIVSLQQRDPIALERWRRTRSTTWLAAALWAVPPQDAAAQDLLAAAAQVPPGSPARPMMSFLQVRLLLERGDPTEARRALADLPADSPTPYDPETLNLLDAARMSTASTLDDLLAAAPRRIVSLAVDGPPQPPEPSQTFDRPLWDDDVATIVNARLPLETLVEAAESTRLPSRLRSRVAQAAFARAIVLQRHAEGRRAAAVLRGLAVPVRADLDRYLRASTDADRQSAALLALLRTPGLSINVQGTDTDNSYEAAEPTRVLGHAFARNWWCAPADATTAGAGVLLFGEGVERPFPPFLSEAQRSAVAQERDALAMAGNGRTYLATSVLAWANARPNDPDVPEALARVVEGWRWSPCAYGEKSTLPQRAFTALHRRYPTSAWTRRTPYWYE